MGIQAAAIERIHEGLDVFALPEELYLYPHSGALEAQVASGGALTLTEHHLTFAALFDKLVPAQSRRRCLPMTGRLLVRDVLRAQSSSLAAFAEEPARVDAVYSALVELRRAGITWQHLEGKLGSKRLRELARVLRDYEAALEKRQLYDQADAERESVLAIAQGKCPRAFSQLRAIYVAPGCDLFGANVDLLRAFGSRGVRIHVTFPFDERRRAVFAWPEALLHRLESSQLRDVEVSYDPRLGSGPLAPLARAAMELPRKPLPTSVANRVHVYEHVNGVQEANRVATEVAKFLAQGVAAADIAVVVPNPELGQMAAQALGAMEISGSPPVGLPLNHTRAGQLLMAASWLPQESFERERLLDLIASMDLRVPVGARMWDASRIIAELRKLGLRTLKVRDFKVELVSRAAKQTRSTQRQEELEALAAFLDRLIREVRSIPGSGALGEFVAAGRALLQLASAPRGLRSDFDGLTARVCERTQKGQRALAELLDEMESVGGDITFSREEFAAWLSHELGRQRLPNRSLTAGTVPILTPQMLLGQRFRCVVLMGVQAGNFPKAIRSQPFLTEDLRGELNRLLGVRLLQYAPTSGRDALDGYARDTWLWLECLNAAREALVVTYTVAETEESLGRSEFVEDLVERLGGEHIVRRELPIADEALATLGPRNPLLPMAWAMVHFDPHTRVSTIGQSPSIAESQAAFLQVKRQRFEKLRERRARWDKDFLAPVGDLHEHQVLSTSKLDTLAKCAFRYAAQVVMGLRPQDETVLGADAREEGNIAHAALFVVYEDMLQHGGLYLARKDPSAAQRRAREVFEKSHAQILAEANIHPVLTPGALETAWDAVLAQLAVDLHPEATHELVALEHAFDDRTPKQHDALVLEHPNIPNRRILVRGSIDRVERDGALLRVLDYKRTVPSVTEGRHFQLPIYAAASLRDFARHDTSQVDVGWIELRTGSRKYPKDIESRAAILGTQLRERVWERLDQVLGGDIAPDPASPKTCTHCDFAPMCGLKEAVA